MDKPIAIISILLALLAGGALSLRYLADEPTVVVVNKESADTANISSSAEGTPLGGGTVSEGDSPIGTDTALSGEPKVAVAGGAYLLSGEKLSGWKTEKRWPIASITKLMTAHVASLVMEPDERVLITQTAVDTIGEAGGLRMGEIIKVSDLVKAMLMVSSNDAAVALANHYGQEEFIALMNQAAQEIGMINTRFVEPTGLSSQNQSTIEDLVALVGYIWEKDKNLLEVSRRYADAIIDTNTGSARQLVSINAFAGRGDFLGGKTGSITASDENLLSVFSVPGRDKPVVIVVFGSKDRFGETEDILNEL